MNHYKTRALGFILALLLVGAVDTGWADSGPRKGDRHPRVGKDERGYVLDSRHRHNNYYPRLGHVVNALPRVHHRVVYRSHNYYFSDGIWFRPSGVSFTVIAPPIGLIVPVLPRFYSTVWVGGFPYYYADNTYYTWQPEYRGYRVAEPPDDRDLYEETEIPEQLFIYPKAGQSDSQVSSDRYECHSWAVTQSGFDPTQPGGNVPVSENAERRANYNRATKACLEARDYSVQ